MNTSDIRYKLERLKGQRDRIVDDLKKSRSRCEGVERQIEYSEKAQAIIQAVARATQEELEYRISEPVSLAMAAVYDDPYKMVAKFEITGRGTTECQLLFERDGHFIKPMEASGGGPVDVASFALRVGGWSLAKPRSRPTLILDEPFKWVSRQKMELAGQMLKEVSSKLGLQIIMISHIPELIEFADKIFQVKIKKGVSEIRAV